MTDRRKSLPLSSAFRNKESRLTALKSEECRIFAEYGWNRGTEFFSFIPRRYANWDGAFYFEGDFGRSKQGLMGYIFPVASSKILVIRKYYLRFFPGYKKNLHPLNFEEPEMPDLWCIWDFLRRRSTCVLQGEKITKVLQIGHFRLVCSTKVTFL